MHINRFAALRRLFASFVSMFFLTALALSAPFPIPLQAGPVTDPANLLESRSAPTAATLASYRARSGHQVVVLVVPTIGPAASIEEYAVGVFNAWGLGRAGNDDGVLLVVAVNQRKVRIEVGYGLEGELTDAVSSRIIREQITPRLSDGDLAGGIAAGVSAIVSVLQPVPVGPRHVEQTANVPMPRDMALAFLGCFSLPFLAAGIFGGGIFGLTGVVSGSVLILYLPPDWRGGVVIAGMLMGWCYLRFKVIANNVKKYYLPKSRFRPLTWFWRMCAMGMSEAPPKPRRKARREGEALAAVEEKVNFWSWNSRVKFNFGFGSDDSSSNSDSSDSGGRSGGGGASGKW